MQNKFKNWNELSFAKKLEYIFISTAITHVQGNQILRLCRTHLCHADLPLDTRTLLKTPREPLPIKTIGRGEYVHIGLECVLFDILNNLQEEIPDLLETDLHTDGAELFKKVSIWPIQCRIVNVSK